MSHSEAAPKILVLRLSSLGDIVLTAPVYRNIKAKWPDARITVLVKPRFAGTLAGLDSVAGVMVFKGLIPAIREIRRQRFTHLLDLHANLRTRLISFFSGIPARVRYRKDALARRLFVGMGVSTPSLQRHTLDRYLDALSEFGVPAIFKTPELSDWTTAGDKSSPRKICVFQTAFLGDAVLTLSLLRKIKEILPGSEVHVVCLPQTKDIFLSCRQVNEIITDDKRSSGFFQTLFSLIQKLKALHPDTAILCHRSFRSSLAARLALIPERVGFGGSPGSIFLTRKVPFSWLLHDLERNLTLLTPFAPHSLHPEKKGEIPSLKISITERLAKAGISGTDTLAGIHPGSVWATKRWLPERYAEVIKKLSANGIRTVLLGDGKDGQWNAGITRMASGSCLDWTGRTTLAELMALMPNLSLFITNDSGPMHVATAFGVPTLAIFGPTTRELGFFPYGEGHRVMEKKLRCRPCGLHGGRKCPRSHFLCMRLITADEVFQAAEEMLGVRRQAVKQAGDYVSR
ncbi:MAG: glycosyltransferase family 9 protein [bacterium]